MLKVIGRQGCPKISGNEHEMGMKTNLSVENYWKIISSSCDHLLFTDSLLRGSCMLNKRGEGLANRGRGKTTFHPKFIAGLDSARHWNDLAHVLSSQSQNR